MGKLKIGIFPATLFYYLGLVNGFLHNSVEHYNAPSIVQKRSKMVPLYVSLNSFARRRVKLPILDLTDSEIKVTTPLPSSHLPEALTTLNLYGIELSRPIHKMIMNEVVENKIDVNDLSAGRTFGYITQKKNSTLVGAIGCSGEILIRAEQPNVEDNSEIGQDAPVMVLYKGCYRFIIREVIKTIPYPVVIVDELIDDDIETDDINNEEIDENADLYYYSQQCDEELKKRIMGATKSFINLKLDEISKLSGASSLLGESILESRGITPSNPADQKMQIEEAAAIFDVFSSSLIDFATTPKERNFAIAMIAAEIFSVNDEIRREIIETTNSIYRLRIICKAAEESVSLIRARKVAIELTENESSEKDLKVGPAQLPPWASQITKGTRVEYYWNEEWGWSPCEVIEEPFKIINELLIKVRFEADGEIHRLPLNPDEKLRWRPAGFGENKYK